MAGKPRPLPHRTQGRGRVLFTDARGPRARSRRTEGEVGAAAHLRTHPRGRLIASRECSRVAAVRRRRSTPRGGHTLTIPAASGGNGGSHGARTRRLLVLGVVSALLAACGTSPTPTPATAGP